MGVYLGNVGNIELIRKSLEGTKESVVNPSDVNASRNRFSFDFDEGYLITGDLIEIKSTDGTDLDFIDETAWTADQITTQGNDPLVTQSSDLIVASYQGPTESGMWYVFVDELGGIRLYDNFDDSLEGSTAGLITLNAINRDIPISVEVNNRGGRLLGCIREYEINTNREVVDITALSDQHRQQYSSLISGSGRLVAEWDYLKEDGSEPVNYLMQLVLRTEIGSSFRGKFYIKSADTSAAGGSFSASQVNDSLWWEFDAIVTGSAVSFAPSDLIVGNIEFVATGPIRLKAKTTASRVLLQESGDAVLLEQSGQLLLEGDEAA
jgi:hypothetical protein